MKICIIVGTRPEIIKMASIIKACEKRNLDYFLLHTGQHYSYEMDKLFFEELELPHPKYNINAGLTSFRLQIGMMLRKIHETLTKEKPDIVLVLGDTNSVLSGALAANKLHIKVGHIEAGLRSHDIAMVEETNRIIVDHIADLLFAPTEEARENILEEGISPDKIYVTGNTIVDAVLMHKELADQKVDILQKLSIEKKNYIVITAHRPETVDIHERLINLLEGFKLVKEKHNLPMIWPIHPRTSKMLKKFNLEVPNGIITITPLGYLEFLQLQANSKIVLTDSGGIQEECCTLNVPCVTLRDNTERPETLNIGSNILVGVNPKNILEGVNKMLSRSTSWKNPFGDGKAGEKILDILLSHYDS